MTILEQIIAQKQKEIEAKKEYFRELRAVYENGNLLKSERRFSQAVRRPSSEKIPNLIAEIKKASPSKGPILENANILQIARLYQENGASAISFLTDEMFFQGKLQEMYEVSQAVGIPVLRKDFILCEEQILEARHFGADGVLLMVSILKNANILQKLRILAEELKMDALVETHTAEEIKIAEESGAKIIGVNARSFSDLSVDTKIFATLLPLISNDKIKIAESGIQDIQDVKKISPLCDAMLVGTALMRDGAEKIPEKIRMLHR